MTVERSSCHLQFYFSAPVPCGNPVPRTVCGNLKSWFVFSLTVNYE